MAKYNKTDRTTRGQDLYQEAVEKWLLDRLNKPKPQVAVVPPTETVEALFAMMKITQITPAYSFQGHADLLIEGTENGVDRSWYYDSLDGTFEGDDDVVVEDISLLTIFGEALQKYAAQSFTQVALFPISRNAT